MKVGVGVVGEVPFRIAVTVARVAESMLNEVRTESIEVTWESVRPVGVVVETCSDSAGRVAGVEVGRDATGGIVASGAEYEYAAEPLVGAGLYMAYEISDAFPAASHATAVISVWLVSVRGVVYRVPVVQVGVVPSVVYRIVVPVSDERVTT